MDPGPIEPRKKSDDSFLGQKLGALRLRRNLQEGSVDNIGDLGLNLLHEPSKCLIDFIFVHGLRGGSRKTWSASPSEAHYWPKAWLPVDPDFRHVRVHSFGYNSDWLDRRENLLNIHDFAQSLMEEIQNSPNIRRSKNTRIVFIGHSMGGLVIKKACILSRENPSFHELGSRIHSLYFLATPHRGSDLAQTLNSILKILPTGSKPFLGSLERGSETINTLNDQFRHICKGMDIHSFTESIPMSWGTGSGLVVDKQSATLGYPDERVQSMNADHRGICKFNSPADTNYRTLRNRLASTVEDIERISSKTSHVAYRDEIQTLSRYLNVSHAPINDLSTLEDDRVPGSCEWLTNSQRFIDWRASDDSPRFCWLTGQPGTGKSVTTAYVVGSLAEDTCSYFFFKHGDQEKSSLNSLLLSIAFQMAQKSDLVRKILLELAQDDSFLDKNDFRGIWRRLFVGGIFRSELASTQYWVIDAFDECVAAEKRSFDNFFTMLAKIEHSIPIKIFISSRLSVDLVRLFSTLPFVRIQISTEYSTQDIRMYVKTYAGDLPAEDDESRANLTETIVRKSAGCFLWTVLVMRQLQEIYTAEEIDKILLEVPEEMEALYTRNLQIMEGQTRTKKLAQAVLVWSLCATRALTVEELKCAIRLDLKITIARDLERSISTLCGQFVFIDKQNRVCIVHETARTFLQNSDLKSDFRVSLPLGNVQLALACFEYLISEEMASVPKTRSSGISIRAADKNALANYACSSFSEHLVRSTSPSDRLFLALTKFLKTNVLAWIERMAENNDLDCLMRTGKHLKAYQAKRVKLMAPLQDDIAAWVTDMPRIATEFGLNLLKYPAAIHEFIPPLCPRGSGIYRSFAALGYGLQLRGLSNNDWNDRISSWHYGKTTAECIASQNQWFAIGLSDGTVDVRWASTCQEAVRLNHGEPVRLIRFGNMAKLLVSTGLTTVKMWDLSTGLGLWVYRLDSNPLGINFDDDDKRLVVATRSKKLFIWSTADGAVLLNDIWYHNLPYDYRHVLSRAPVAVEISASHKMMAIVYRSLPPCLWDLETQQPLGFCTKILKDDREGANNITSVCFNPIQILNLIAVAYMDGDVVLFDTISRTMRCQAKLDTQVLSVSPDGRTLAGGESIGTVKLFDFESLQLLYHVTLSDYGIAALAFTGDSLRFIDLRGVQANVWEPPALVRNWNYSDEETSGFSREATGSIIQGARTAPVDEVGQITTLKAIYTGSIAICGKDNGAVDIYDLNSIESAFEVLYKHKGSYISILALDWNEAQQMVASADSSSCFMVVRLLKNKQNNIVIQEVVLEAQLPYAHSVNQLLINHDGTKILVSCSTADFLWSLQTGKLVASQETDPRANWRWFTNPQDVTEVLLLQSSILQYFSWEASKTFMSISESSVDIGSGQFVDMENIIIDSTNNAVILKLSPLLLDSQQNNNLARNGKNVSVYAMNLSTSSDNLPLVLKPILGLSDAENPTSVSTLLGTVQSIHDGSLLALIVEGGWICTVDLGAANLHPSFQRHFFIPSTWLNANEKIISVVTERKDILFVRGQEIAVIKYALDIARRP